jgi:hypothetical protein
MRFAHRSFSFLFIAVSVATTGCGGPCDTLITSGSSHDAALLSSPSTALVDAARAGGESDAEIAWRYPSNLAVTDLDTQLLSKLPADADPSLRCISVSLVGTPTRLGLDCPSVPGSYGLDVLHAVACDTVCTALTGTITVRAIAVPCGNGACGRLDADIDLPVPAAASNGPSVSGHATLSYSEQDFKQYCPASLSDG